jgi:hypothetical protein
MLRRCLFHRSYRYHCPLYHLLAGAVAGVAGATDFLSSFLSELLVAGFLAAPFTTSASALTTGLGASALVTAGVATGALAGSAANADTANTDAITSASDFILVSFEINAEFICIY